MKKLPSMQSVNSIDVIYNFVYLHSSYKFYYISIKTYCGYSMRKFSSFEHPKHMFRLMVSKNDCHFMSKDFHLSWRMLTLQGYLPLFRGDVKEERGRKW